jgi:hypothetical protein
MTSSLLHGRLCIILAIAILLFLPLTFNTNNINNNASAQTSQCDPNNLNSVECNYELRVQNYSNCLKGIEAWNALGYFQLDPLQQCQHLKPIESSQPQFQGPSGVPGTTVANQMISSELAIAIGGTIAAGGAGGVILLYKQGYLKGVKHIVKKPQDKVANKHQEAKTDNNLPIIELRIECGLEKSEVIDRESDKGYNTITGELTEVQQKLSQALNKILENRRKIKNIQKDIDFIKWCKEAREDPNKILSNISEEVIGKFLTSVQPYFQNLMLSQIGVESDISVTEDNPMRIRKNITFSLNPIQTYIALVVYNNGLPVSSTKFIFAINIYVQIKNLSVYLERLNRHQAQLEQQPEQQLQYREEESGDDDSVSRRRIEIEGLLFGISIEFSKIKIGNIEKPIEPPLDLGRKEVEIKKKIIYFSK